MVPNKRKILITVISIVVVLLISAILTSCTGGGGPFSGLSEEGEGRQIETFQVQKGNIYQTVSTSGSVDSNSLDTYSMQVSGEILFALEKGDYFKSDDMLVEVDNSDGLLQLEQIEKNLKLSEISLKTAKMNYQAALDSNHIAIQMAELNTEKAEESTESALRSLEIANENAGLSYQSAERALEEAEEMLELAEDDPDTTDMQMAQYESSVESAEEKLESAKISNNSSASQSESSYDQALNNQATTYWNNLSSLQSAERQIESTRDNIEQTEIQLELAKMDYESAKEGLDDYVLYAPYDGVVISSDFKTGSQSSAGNTISIISNNFWIKATIGETEISKISEGDEAYITLDAYSDYQFLGEVEKIIPVAVEEGNIVSFEIIIGFDDTGDTEIFYGLSADVDIVTEKAENILYVPISAVYTENGKSYVDILVSKQADAENIAQSVEKTEVTTGINDYSYIEVTSGLKDGDIVVTSRI